MKLLAIIITLFLLCTPAKAQHWTYPGTIDKHLQLDHKVNIAGLSHEQQLDLHDALHEGRAVSQGGRAVVNTKRTRRFVRFFR
jgi:hypothetical protein